MSGITLGFLKFVLGFDSLSFRKGMTEAERDLVKMQKKFESVGNKMTQLGKTLSIGITAPLAAISVKSFEVAKDVGEMESAFNVTFGGMAESVRKWATETGKQMGRSRVTLQESALAFQQFFGKAADPAKSIALSKQFAVLTQDLASFSNISKEVAQQKLLSGLSGEAEPLRAVGVFLSDAKVQAAALELGLNGVNGKLSEEEKILARALAIQKQLAQANGDAIRTKNSTAGQIVQAKEAFLDLQVVIGEKLLPVLTPIITKVAEALQLFLQLPAPVQEAALVTAALSAALGPLVAVFGGFISVLAKSGPLIKALAVGWSTLSTSLAAARVAALAALPALAPFLVPLAAIAAAVGAAYLAWKNWDNIAPIVQRMVAGVKSAMGVLTSILNAALRPIQTVQKAFFNLYDKVVGHSYVPDMVEGIRVEMAKLDGVMTQPAVAATSKTSEAFKALQSAVGGLLAQLFPEQARQNEFLKQVQLLDAAVRSGAISAATYSAALAQLESQMGMTRDGLTEVPLAFDTEEARKGMLDGIDADLENAGKIDPPQIQPGTGTGLNDGLQRISELLATIGSVGKSSFASVAQEILDSAIPAIEAMKNQTATLSEKLAALGQLATSIFTKLFGKKAGGIIGALFNALPALASAFGGARANGGPIVPGRTYLVGENGPEFVTPNRRGFVHPNGSGMGGMSVSIVPSPYFDAVVDHRAGKVAAPMAGRAAIMGAGGAEQRAATRQRRAIP